MLTLTLTLTLSINPNTNPNHLPVRTSGPQVRSLHFTSGLENDYCGGDKPGLSPPLLILTLTLTLNPNLKDVTKPNPSPTDPTNPK